MITDNCQKKRGDLKCDSFSAEQWEILKKSISHRTVEELCNNHPNLLVFPQCIKNIDEDLGEQTICDIMDDKISTNNLVGFIGVRDADSGKHVELSIRSRFQQNGHEDFFLHYMLEKAFKVHVFNMEHGKSNDDVFDFALYLFPQYLKRAIKQGLFKQYRTREYNDANVRGVIDVTRHIRLNTPFNGRIAYRTREFQYDNSITQLIRHTIEYIRTHKWAGNILKQDKVMCDCVRTIYDITPSYKANDRQKVISQNLKPIHHPYFTEYTLLQRLCLQILRHNSIKYGVSDDKIHGILFDCAWLWEEYLATIIPQDYTHGVRSKQNGYKFYIGESDHQRYPDFFSTNKRIVLDAKYKRVDSGIQRNDLFQIIAYIHTLPKEGALMGGLIYPSETSQKPTAKTLNGYNGTLLTLPLKIPRSDDYATFRDEMNSNSRVFVDNLKVYAK